MTEKPEAEVMETTEIFRSYGVTEEESQPYILLATASAALSVSVTITLLALAMFGYVKGRFTGAPPWRSAMQTVLIGGVAAGVAFMIARAIS